MSHFFCASQSPPRLIPRAVKRKESIFGSCAPIAPAITLCTAPTVAPSAAIDRGFKSISHSFRFSFQLAMYSFRWTYSETENERKERKTSTCRVISLTFRRNRRWEENHYTVFLFFVRSLTSSRIYTFEYFIITSSARSAFMVSQWGKSRNRIRTGRKKRKTHRILSRFLFTAICPHGFDVRQMWTYAARTTAYRQCW